MELQKPSVVSAGTECDKLGERSSFWEVGMTPTIFGKEKSRSA